MLASEYSSASAGTAEEKDEASEWSKRDDVQPRSATQLDSLGIVRSPSLVTSRLSKAC